MLGNFKYSQPNCCFSFCNSFVEIPFWHSVICIDQIRNFKIAWLTERATRPQALKVLSLSGQTLNFQLVKFEERGKQVFQRWLWANSKVYNVETYLMLYRTCMIFIIIVEDGKYFLQNSRFFKWQWRFWGSRCSFLLLFFLEQLALLLKLFPRCASVFCSHASYHL